MRRKDRVKLWVLMVELAVQGVACGVWSYAVFRPDRLGEVQAQLAEALLGLLLFSVLILLLLISSRERGRRKKRKRLAEEYVEWPAPSERSLVDELTRQYIKLHSINGVAVVALLCLTMIALFAIYSIGI